MGSLSTRSRGLSGAPANFSNPGVNAIDKGELNFKPDRQMPRVAPWCSFGLNTEIARAHLRFRIPLSQQRRASRCVYA
jgi:hypothetical protein